MITLEANYSKKIGLPGFSSHQFSLTLKSELTDVSQVEKESARLYAVLQQSVDDNIQQIGFLPSEPAKTNGNGHSNGSGNGHQREVRPTGADAWKCSPAQKDLILRKTDENQLDKNEVEQMAQQMFGKGVKQLNKLQAGGLIAELIEKYPGQKGGAYARRR
jgi:hypothetical protein